MDELEKGELYWEHQKVQGDKAASRIPQVEIWKNDSEILKNFIDSICTYENRGAWSEIVDRWLKTHNLRVVEWGPKQELELNRKVIAHYEVDKSIGRKPSINANDYEKAKKEVETLEKELAQPV